MVQLRWKNQKSPMNGGKYEKLEANGKWKVVDHSAVKRIMRSGKMIRWN
jgi:hypothetical protein